MKHRLSIIIILFSISHLFSIAQNTKTETISIEWIDTPTMVKNAFVTLKWGIKAQSQITDISITLNGLSVKGIDAVINDGYDMKKSQVLKLEKGENVVEIIVTTTNGSNNSSKIITLSADSDNNIHNDFENYENADSMIFAAYRGETKAQYLMAKSYLNGTNGLERDLFESSLWFKKSAEGLYPPSQYEYAIALLEGRGILKNPKSAIYWLAQSETNGYAEARFKLGLCYELGDGVGKDVKKAKDLYRKCPLPEAKQRLLALEKQ